MPAGAGGIGSGERGSACAAEKSTRFAADPGRDVTVAPLIGSGIGAAPPLIGRERDGEAIWWAELPPPLGSPWPEPGRPLGLPAREPLIEKPVPLVAVDIGRQCSLVCGAAPGRQMDS